MRPPVPPGDALPHVCTSLYLAEAPYLWPCLIVAMPPDLGQQSSSQLGEADAERRPPSENGLSRPTDITPPLSYLYLGISVDTVETARTLSLAPGPGVGVGLQQVFGVKHFPVRIALTCFHQCLTCVCVSPHLSMFRIPARPASPSAGSSPPVPWWYHDTQMSGFPQIGRLCVAPISCPCEDTDAALASDSQEATPTPFTFATCCTCGF